MKITVHANDGNVVLRVNPAEVHQLDLGTPAAERQVGTPPLAPQATQATSMPLGATALAQPSSAPVPEPAAPQVADLKDSKEYERWGDFVLMWCKNFDQEGPQPDRGEETRSLGHSRYNGKVLVLVHNLGGLTNAVYAVLSDGDDARIPLSARESDKTLRTFARRVAENMAQVSSILFSDLSDLLEYHDPLTLDDSDA